MAVELDISDLPDDIFIYRANPYSMLVLYTFDWDRYLEGRDYFGMPEYDFEGAVMGMTTLFQHDETGVRSMLIFINPSEANTVVHECAHAALFIMNEIGHNPFDGHEPFVYLLEHMYDDINNARIIWGINNGPSKDKAV